jgi:hypothetical protein
MEYRGKRYLILRRVKSNLWAWSVFLDANITAKGEATSREDAMTKVVHLIDRVLDKPTTLH